jgi:hypothetical protein
MKKIIIFLSLLISFQTFASGGAGIYCKVNGKYVDTLSEDGHYNCASAFLDGTACYAGARADALKLFTDLQDTDFNWDEEWIEDIHFKGKNEISYAFVDGPNELRVKRSLRPCK